MSVLPDSMTLTHGEELVDAVQIPTSRNCLFASHHLLIAAQLLESVDENQISPLLTQLASVLIQRVPEDERKEVQAVASRLMTAFAQKDIKPC